MEVGQKTKNEKIRALIASYCLLDMPGTMHSWNLNDTIAC